MSASEREQKAPGSSLVRSSTRTPVSDMTKAILARLETRRAACSGVAFAPGAAKVPPPPDITGMGPSRQFLETTIKVPAPFAGVSDLGFSARYPNQPFLEPLRDVPLWIEG